MKRDGLLRLFFLVLNFTESMIWELEAAWLKI